MPVTLTGGAQVNSIFVSGNDVYVAGGEFTEGDISVATYWRNSVPMVLTDGTEAALASSIFVPEPMCMWRGQDQNHCRLSRHVHYLCGRAVLEDWNACRS